MTLVTDGHILVDENGEAWIDSTNVKVIEVVLDKLSHGSTAEEMHIQLPHLSVAQIYASLTYYHDHKPEFDERIAREREEIAAMRTASDETPGRAKVRELGLRP